jgi:hypothetical protein
LLRLSLGSDEVNLAQDISTVKLQKIAMMLELLKNSLGGNSFESTSFCDRRKEAVDLAKVLKNSSSGGNSTL